MTKDYTIPYQDLVSLVPKNLRNPVITSLIDNLFNRFLTSDESIPLYGYVGVKPSSTEDITPKIPQPSVERDVNALIPVYSFKVGQDTYSFTPQDIVRKAEVLGVSKDHSTWLYSQGNNYAPPINLEKFTNFFNYYWIANTLPNPPVMSWNPTCAPEYYTIAAPLLTDPDKLNVRTASVNGDVNPIMPLSRPALTGSGFYPMTFTITFTDSDNFTVQAVPVPPGSLDGFAPGEDVQNFTLQTLSPAAPFPGPWPTYTDSFAFSVASSAAPLLTFDIVRDVVLDGTGNPLGYEQFAAGDTFTISAPFISSTHSITINSVSTGVKGKFRNIDSLDEYRTIGGVQVKENDRVLIRNGPNSQQYIYIVKPGAWELAPDFNGSTAAAGAKVWVREGVNAGRMYQSAAVSGGYSWTLLGTNMISNTNDWQESNYWVNSNDLASMNIDRARVIQATRPIIEFSAAVQLNHYVAGGLPADATTPGAVFYHQRKTEFNQAPMYDLYRYDGTHARAVTPLFFYVEDPTEAVDPALQRRVKFTASSSADFLFDHGLREGNSLLFYKRNGELKTIWHPGYTQPTVVDQVQGGAGNGTITIDLSTADPFTPQQIWTLTATSPTSFSVSGSKNKVLPAPYDVIIVDTPYSNGLFSATITSGSTPFEVGDVFVFRVGNLETTRYVYRDSNEQLYDLYGGQANDVAGIGAWQVPRMFFNNVAAENGGEIAEGTLYSHFRGILMNQLTTEDRAFGGSIKLWSEQLNLLSSLMMQRDLTPISVIDLAQRQYESALNSLVDLFTKHIVQYQTSTEVLVSPADTNELLDYLLSIRANDNDVRSVLYDSTSGVIGFPATLPQLGVTPRVLPEVYFDNELGATLMRHHDGHASPLFVNSQEFIDRLLSPGMLILRSDGSYTPAVGSYTTAAPSLPYKGELWQCPIQGGFELRVFNVLADTSVAPVALQVGDYWYNRGSNTLFVWDGADWQVEPNPLAAWIVFDPASVLNDLIHDVELRLYNNTNPDQRTYFTADVQSALYGSLAPELQEELAKWAAANGYDATAPDYVSTDAFTWNYTGLSTGDLAPIDLAATPARWYNVLQAHQRTVPGVIPTSRPNLEPWLLLGNTTKPVGWDATYASDITPEQLAELSIINGGVVKAVKYSETPINTSLVGLPTVDGVTLSAGEVLLLVSEAAAANNGAWVVSTGGWVRAAVPLVQNTVVTVSHGSLYAGTTWWLSASVNTINVDPVLFKQVRYWKQSMWADISAARPTLKLSVHVGTDALLPPYVNPTFAYSTQALTNTQPPTPAQPYAFGEGSLVETVWTRSIEYRYSLSRALFRADPLTWLGFLWGFEWVEVDNILYDGFDVAVPGISRFRLHGDAIASVTRVAPLQLSAVTAGTSVDITITHDAYSAARKQSWTIRTRDGVVLGHVIEGAAPTTISSGGYTLSNLRIEDEGKPFRVGDSFHITGDGTGAFTAVLNQASYAQIRGFGQTFTHAMREASIDTNQGYAIKAYSGWDVNLGYRAGGLVSTDDLRVYTDSLTLSESAYELRFKQSPYAKDIWVQGLRVSVVQLGSSEVNKFGSQVPTNDASDWVFRVEGYNPRYLGVEYYTYNPSGTAISFYALNKAHTDLPWYQKTQVASVQTADLPITFTGLQSVIDFLFGYSARLEDLGWRFNDDGIQNIDASTGRVRNWQLEIEKLIDAVYTGTQVGQGQVVNPFMDRVWVQHDTGLLSKFFDTALFDVTGHPGIFDTLGVKIETDAITVLRGREKSMISSTVPMFSAHAQIDEYEHLFVFNNMISPTTGEGLIYDPFSAARIATIKMNGRRQAADTLRPEFGGHYLVGNEVRQNIKGATDKVAHYYDADSVFEDQISTRHALALLGFSPKQYMADLDLNDRSQFNFWRGLIQMKGTNASVDAFLNNERFYDARLDEYWAYKVAEYGDARAKAFPELKISVTDTVQQFTKLLFTEGSAPSGYETFTTIRADDESRWFSIDDLDGETTFEAKVIGTYEREVQTDEVFTLPFIADKLIVSGVTATQVNGTTLKATGTGTISVVGYGPSTPKFNPVKLFNYAQPELVAEIPLWHPAIGQHTPAALEAVNIISDLDPARYNTSTLVQGNVNYDPLRVWGAKEVGRVWWDTTNLDYLPYADQTIFSSVDERLSRWGTLAAYASVDVVEWVESSVPPTEYNLQASVDAGNTDIDASTRANGEVYGEKTYVRGRIWNICPIAWSNAGVATSAAHPSFNASYSSNLTFTNDGLIVLESGTFQEFGITAGMRVGAWQEDEIATRPLSEYLITGEFTKQILGAPSSFTGYDSPYDDVGEFTGSIALEIDEHTDKVGQLVFTDFSSSSAAFWATDENGAATASVWDVSTYLRITEAVSGEEDVVLIRTDRGADSNVQPASSGYQQVLFDSAITVDTPTGYFAGVDAAPASQVVKFGMPKTPTSSTGLTVGTTYTFTATLDSVPYTVTVNDVTAAATFDDLVTQINADLPGAPCSINADGNLVFVDNVSVDIVDDTLFAALNDFDSIEAETPAVIAQSPTVYTANLILDGVLYSTPISGTIASVGELIIAVNTAISGTPLSIQGSSIVCTSPSTGITSTANISGDAFSALTGFDSFGPMVIGTDAETVEYHGATFSTSIGQKFYFTSGFGLRIVLTSGVDGEFSTEVMAKFLAQNLAANVNLKDAARVELVAPLSDPDSLVTDPSMLSNDELDPQHATNNGVGWRAWQVPTQQMLSADSRVPNSTWLPYVGEFVQVSPTAAVITDAVQNNTLTLNNGTTVTRYSTTWENWTELKQVVMRDTRISGTGSVAFQVADGVSLDRISVYVNGVAQLRGTYTLVGTTLTVLSVPEGNQVVVIVRQYTPSTEELAFDPSVEDDLTIQNQYKVDFPYVTIPVRDSEGAITTTKYYFWVKNRTIAARNKNLSVKAVSNLLVQGPSQYLTFQHINDTAPFFYDAITISGLSHVVTKDDTFKLRFTRNFTLRDDPQDRDMLKNTHTEWTLIRPGQRTRIPEELWNKMVNTACGQDAAGNTLPSPQRAAYDERNGTRSRFGFGADQVLAPSELVISTLQFTILNTSLVNDAGAVPVPDYMTFLDFSMSDTWFSTPSNTRNTLTRIWNEGKVSQINELFFAVLNDIVASNYELTDLFKTSRLSAYSIKVVNTPVVQPTYE